MQSTHVDFLKEMIKVSFPGEPLTDHLKAELQREEAKKQPRKAMAAGAGR